MNNEQLEVLKDLRKDILDSSSCLSARNIAIQNYKTFLEASHIENELVNGLDDDVKVAANFVNNLMKKGGE
jgi:hypothetical protein